VNSALSGIPVDRRRRLAATLGLFAVLFVAVGIVATTGSTPGVVRIFSAVALTVAAALGLMAWGVAHSIKIELADQRLDRAIDEAIAARDGHSGAGIACACGHDHNPSEMQITGEACAHDGTGIACGHDCETCVLTSLRPSPTTPRAERIHRHDV
jgi:ABC-type nickel/cobalt efflux system permease component RcnA